MFLLCGREGGREAGAWSSWACRGVGGIVGGDDSFGEDFHLRVVLAAPCLFRPSPRKDFPSQGGWEWGPGVTIGPSGQAVGPLAIPRSGSIPLRFFHVFLVY